jgi:hypothetical protein
MKQFLKPSWRKIIIFLILFVVTSIFSSSIISIIELVTGPPSTILSIEVDYVLLSLGFPFVFYQMFNSGRIFFIFQAIAKDVIIWYLISCLVVWVFDKFKNFRRIR